MMSQKSNDCLNCSKCAIRRDSVFSALMTDEIETLQIARNHLAFNYGELIFKEGQYPSGVYIITKGKVKIAKYGYENREQIVRFARQGDILGYRALIGGERYTCSALAMHETHLCYLPRDFIFDHVMVNPELAVKLMRLMANDLRKAEEKFLSMAQKSVRERVAESILILKEMYGYEDDESTINISLKREEFASIAGTVRETATRFLLEFSNDQMILLKGKKIKILNIDKLIRCANL